MKTEWTTDDPFELEAKGKDGGKLVIWISQVARGIVSYELSPDTVDIGDIVHLVVFFGLWISTKAPEPVENMAEKSPIWKSHICSTGDLDIILAHESLIALPI
jgi:hypothetical protein